MFLFVCLFLNAALTATYIEATKVILGFKIIPRMLVIKSDGEINNMVRKFFQNKNPQSGQQKRLLHELQL